MAKRKTPPPGTGTCSECSRTIRSGWPKASQFPGSVRGRLARSICNECDRKLRPPATQKRPVYCAECNRPIRPKSARLIDFPGTVQGVLSRGICNACENGGRAHGEAKRCQGCCKMMRPYKARKADYPDTVARGTAQLCLSCYEKERRGLPWWEIEARSLEIFPLSHEEKLAATRVIMRSGGDILVLEALGLKDVYAEVR